MRPRELVFAVLLVFKMPIIVMKAAISRVFIFFTLYLFLVKHVCKGINILLEQQGGRMDFLIKAPR